MKALSTGAIAVLLAAIAAACSAPHPNAGSTSESPGGPQPDAGEVRLTVFAAASLSAAFREIEDDFEAANPGVDVVYNFGGSADLAAQIDEGAPADVLATADMAQMTAVAGAVPLPILFASNTLALAVASGNPLGLTSLEDVAAREVALVVCAPAVPCGAATRSLAASIGVELTPSSEEFNVTDVAGKVASGQADAGIVYVTDIARMPGLDGVTIEGSAGVVNRYPIGVLARSGQPGAAGDFVSWVVSGKGQSVLAAHGFGAT